MAGGGVASLQHTSSEDEIFYGSPDASLIQRSYRKPYMVAVESITNVINGSPSFGGTGTLEITKSADCVGASQLRVELPAITAGVGGCSWVKELGHHLIQEINFDIGNITVDRNTGEWFSIYNALTRPVGHDDKYNDMIGNISSMTGTIGGAHAAAATETIPAKVLYIPLIFTWNRHPTSYIPLACLWRHNMRVNIRFRQFSELIRGAVTATPQLGNVSLLCDYVYVINEERDRLIGMAQEYITEQVHVLDRVPVSGSSVRARLSFGHPSKALFYIVRRSDCLDPSSNATLDYTNYTTQTDGDGVNTIVSSSLLLNNQERQQARDGDYSSKVQPLQYFPRGGPIGLNMFSLSMYPASLDPSGSTNFTAFEHAELLVETHSSLNAVSKVLTVLDFGLNMIRFIGGVGGPGFA